MDPFTAKFGMPPRQVPEGVVRNLPLGIGGGIIFGPLLFFSFTGPLFEVDKIVWAVRLVFAALFFGICIPVAIAAQRAHALFQWGVVQPGQIVHTTIWQTSSGVPRGWQYTVVVGNQQARFERVGGQQLAGTIPVLVKDGYAGIWREAVGIGALLHVPARLMVARLAPRTM